MSAREHGTQGGGGKDCVCVCVCVCVFVLRPVLLSYRGDRTRAISSACKSDQADFTDWMSFLTSNPMEGISPNSSA